ncbi:MAG: DUF2085 domain-containing protein [Coriobacteriales bacterium]|nr:DUF2085 domain-containing protein [Coriobacteriales bacterium]
MQAILYFFGHGFCHQIPQRSFEVAGLFFSACARDTGIYLGLAFSVLVAFAFYARVKQKPAGLPPTRIIVVLVILALPMVLDALTSYTGLRETTNVIRYVSGFLMGCAVGSLVVPFLFALRKDAREDIPVFSRPAGFALYLALTLLLGAVFLFMLPFGGYVALFLPVLAFVGILVTLNLLVLTLFKRLVPTGSAKRWMVGLAIAIVLALLEITLMGLLRDVVFTVLLGGISLEQILR